MELHHLIHRADGGSHDASNIVLACSACHQAHHDGRLTISGTADRIEVRRRGPSPSAHVDATNAAPAARLGAHVDAMSAARLRTHVDTAPVAHSGAHVDTAPVARSGAHVGATPVARFGAHVDATPVARSGAHVGATSADRLGAHVDAADKLDGAIVRTQAKAALIGLGWKPTIAQAAVAAAGAALGTELALERLIAEALRRCPVPSA
jgi:hypothetical protein